MLLIRVLIILLCAGLVNTVSGLTITEGPEIQYDNDNVYINTNDILIYSTYEVMGSGYTYIDFSAKQYTGNIDLAIGFDTENVQPKKVEFYDGLNWIDISYKFFEVPYVVHNNYDNKNKWYAIKNQGVMAGTIYKIRIYANAHIELNKEGYKYDIIVKPSEQSFLNAQLAGKLYVLDPYWNTSWLNRLVNNLPNGVRPYLYSLNISNDVGTNNATHVFGNGNFNSNYSDIRITYSNGTVISHAIENDSADPTVLWTNITSNGTIYLYYNNDEAQSVSDYSSVVSGGSITGVDGYIIHNFTSSGSFNSYGSFNVGALVVAGGGGGGAGDSGVARSGGGGGAGGYRTAFDFPVIQKTYTVTVGDGGSGGGVSGDDSVFDTITSIGGGGGGIGGAGVGLDGGSGGGSGRNQIGDVGDGTAGQGNDGGLGASGITSSEGAGGGGGKSAVGSPGTNSVGGDGGDGLQSSISGSSVYYGGGGGGGRGAGSPGNGGEGGGGNGGANAVGSPGTANTGGGGGGGSTTGASTYTGGAGGSGIVIIRYNESGTWGTWSEEQYYVDSLHYNATDNYNNTIDVDGSITSNRTLNSNDDTNWTAYSTGLTNWIFENAINGNGYSNFSISGDNLDNFTAHNLNVLSSYSLFNSSGEIETKNTSVDGIVTFEINLKQDNYWLKYNEEENNTPDFIDYYPNLTTISIRGVNQIFAINTSQIVNVSWSIDDIIVKNESNVVYSNYNNSTAQLNNYTVSVIISNVNGSNQLNWSWSVIYNYYDEIEALKTEIIGLKNTQVLTQTVLILVFGLIIVFSKRRQYNKSDKDNYK